MLAVVLVPLGGVRRAHLEDRIVEHPVFIPLDDDAVNAAVPHDIVVYGQFPRLVIATDAHATEPIMTQESLGLAAVDPIVVDHRAAAARQLRVDQRDIAGKQASVIDVVVLNALVAARTLEQGIAPVVDSVVARARAVAANQ